MKKMISMLIVYFMVIGFIVRNFIFEIKLEVKEVLCYLKEKIIFVTKKICVFILKLYGNGILSKMYTLVGCVYTLLSVVGIGSMLKVCLLLRKIGLILTILNGTIYISLLISI